MWSTIAVSASLIPSPLWLPELRRWSSFFSFRPRFSSLFPLTSRFFSPKLHNLYACLVHQYLECKQVQFAIKWKKVFPTFIRSNLAGYLSQKKPPKTFKTLFTKHKRSHSIIVSINYICFALLVSRTKWGIRLRKPLKGDFASRSTNIRIYCQHQQRSSYEAWGDGFIYPAVQIVQQHHQQQIWLFSLTPRDTALTIISLTAGEPRFPLHRTLNQVPPLCYFHWWVTKEVIIPWQKAKI